MNEKYDRATATHYSAYRPLLHELILRYVLLKNEIFPVGLDVGCDTGFKSNYLFFKISNKLQLNVYES